MELYKVDLNVSTEGHRESYHVGWYPNPQLATNAAKEETKEPENPQGKSVYSEITKYTFNSDVAWHWLVGEGVDGDELKTQQDIRESLCDHLGEYLEPELDYEDMDGQWEVFHYHHPSITDLIYIAYYHDRYMNYAYKFRGAFAGMQGETTEDLSDNPDSTFKTWHLLTNLTLGSFKGLSWSEKLELLEDAVSPLGGKWDGFGKRTRLGDLLEELGFSKPSQVKTVGTLPSKVKMLIESDDRFIDWLPCGDFEIDTDYTEYFIEDLWASMSSAMVTKGCKYDERSEIGHEDWAVWG